MPVRASGGSNSHLPSSHLVHTLHDMESFSSGWKNPFSQSRQLSRREVATTLCPSHKDMMSCLFIFFGGTNHVGTVCHGEGLNVPFGHVLASKLRASLQRVIVNMSSLTGSMLNSLLEVAPCVSYCARWAPESHTALRDAPL